MSADRELLELAAKAVAIELKWSSVEGLSPRCADTFDTWNPLTDDGDALRLAVKLKKFPHLLHDGDGVITGYEAKRNSFSPIIEQFGDDPDAATRRAIVRAAAEIGRATPQNKE